MPGMDPGGARRESPRRCAAALAPHPALLLDGRPDMEFLEVLTEHLDRVMLVRGGGREVITIYS